MGTYNQHGFEKSALHLQKRKRTEIHTKHEANHLEGYSAQPSGMEDIDSECSHPRVTSHQTFRSLRQSLDPAAASLSLQLLALPVAFCLCGLISSGYFIGVESHNM